jgi:iron complex outermembrane receptor protein
MDQSLHFKRSAAKHRWGVVLAWTGWCISFALGQTAPQEVDLTELSLEDLMGIKVTLVSRRPEKMSEIAAAVYVLTNEDIRRAGVTTIPDALRLVPGVGVGRIDANKWAISSRGFMDLFANKQLVLIDGRCVYSPIFSGVLWEAQDVYLPDIDRIEVIRGPGASLWGANAVNGIINIVTRKAIETRGIETYAGGGTELKKFGGARYGGANRSGFAYRIYAKYFDCGASVFEEGSRAADNWDVLRGGFRMDWDHQTGESFTLQGDAYGGRVGSTLQIPVLALRGFGYPTPISGGNLLGRLTRTFSPTSDLIFQFYVDRVVRKDSVTVSGSYHTVDFDLQHRLRAGRAIDMVWGVGYRHTADQIEENEYIVYDPWKRNYGIASAFVQDEISFLKNRLRLAAGSKFEYNDFSGFEYQPSLRLLLKLNKRHSVWAAVSRAVRTPSRTEEDLHHILVEGNRDFLSEKLLAFEWGWHCYATERLYIDVAAYVNRYHHLRSTEPIVFRNKLSARTGGVEVAADWSPSDWWRLRLGYTGCELNTSLDSGSLNFDALRMGDESPARQFTVHSSMELAGHVEFDLTGRAASRIASTRLNRVPSYFEIDTRIGCSPAQGLELSLTGKNLLKKRHPEFLANWITSVPTDVQRSLSCTLSLTL